MPPAHLSILDAACHTPVYALAEVPELATACDTAIWYARHV